ncbi:MAG: hypothetical protein FJW40_25300 [Acidobacteria bacterium]|nr:hypothetical protein [Acidobacteriota bacterium]
MVRGGSWNNNSRNNRASNRNRNQPANRNNNNGFRCVRDVRGSGLPLPVPGVERSRPFSACHSHFRAAARAKGETPAPNINCSRPCGSLRVKPGRDLIRPTYSTRPSRSPLACPSAARPHGRSVCYRKTTTWPSRYPSRPMYLRTPRIASSSESCTILILNLDPKHRTQGHPFALRFHGFTATMEVHASESPQLKRSSPSGKGVFPHVESPQGRRASQTYHQLHTAPGAPRRGASQGESQHVPQPQPF